MEKWNLRVNTSYALCGGLMETRNHTFFCCLYTEQVWEKLTKGLLKNHYTSSWAQLRTLIWDTTLAPQPLLLLRYALQAIFHSIWRERNNHRHGEHPSQQTQLHKFIDKSIRNSLSILRNIRNWKIWGPPHVMVLFSNLKCKSQNAMFLFC